MSEIGCRHDAHIDFLLSHYSDPAERRKREADLLKLSPRRIAKLCKELKKAA
jgi:hypothetical protein